MYMKKEMYMRQTQYSVVVILKQSQFSCFAMTGIKCVYSLPKTMQPSLQLCHRPGSPILQLLGTN